MSVAASQGQAGTVSAAGIRKKQSLEPEWHGKFVALDFDTRRFATEIIFF